MRAHNISLAAGDHEAPESLAFLQWDDRECERVEHRFWGLVMRHRPLNEVYPLGCQCLRALQAPLESEGGARTGVASGYGLARMAARRASGERDAAASNPRPP